MIAIERTHDVELVRRVMTHPRIYPHISDDGSMLAAQFDPTVVVQSDAWYFLAARTEKEVVGVWLFHPHNTVTYEVHTCVLPQFWGDVCHEGARAVVAWMFANTPCRKIITHVPRYNRLALKLAETTGLSIEGINRRSFLKDGELHDQYMLGICKE